MTDTKLESPRLPPRWFIRTAWRVHRGLYRMTGGRFGLRRPKPGRYGLMRVTTTGRRTGRERSVMLAYFEDGPALVTMAMNGWGAAEPAWWLNLLANPSARVELVDGAHDMLGRAATGEEHDRLWASWKEYDAQLEGYATRREHTAVVVLEPNDAA